MLRNILFLLVMWLGVVSAQDLVFIGEPSARALLDDGSAESKTLTKSQSKEFECRITRSSLGKYYWQSREGGELVRRETDAFIWFYAADGSGYVKIAKKSSPLSFKNDYVEHLQIMLGSINYYGKIGLLR